MICRIFSIRYACAHHLIFASFSFLPLLRQISPVGFSSLGLGGVHTGTVADPVFSIGAFEDGHLVISVMSCQKLVFEKLKQMEHFTDIAGITGGIQGVVFVPSQYQNMVEVIRIESINDFLDLNIQPGKAI